jgi:mRNA-degrading endonuclease RelE of RelBE toxin-antitoxin system
MDRAWENGLEVSRQDLEILKSGIQRFRGQGYRLVLDVRISNQMMDRGSRADPTEV